MGELKSAWEIAQEKASKLGKLSAEEKRQQMEQRCHQIGKAMAQTYLDHQEGQNITTQLSNYPEEEKRLIAQAIVGHLSEALSLRNPKITENPQGFSSVSRLEKIIQGIATIAPKLQPVTSQISLLIQEYQQAGEKTRQEIENKGRERLHQLRISGTAVGGINIEATLEWQEDWYKLAQPFEERLNELKQELPQLSRA
jgi:hypothetical protein